MLAKLKTATWEVWQYNLANAIMPSWVAQCTVFRTNSDNDGLYLVRRSGKQRIEPYEWLLRNLDGEPEWMSNEAFHQAYEIVK